MPASLVDRVQVNENNREPRQPLVLLVDTSGSMAADLPDVAAGLSTLRAALGRDSVARNRVELAVDCTGISTRCAATFFLGSPMARAESPWIVANSPGPREEMKVRPARMNNHGLEPHEKISSHVAETSRLRRAAASMRSSSERAPPRPKRPSRAAEDARSATRNTSFLRTEPLENAQYRRYFAVRSPRNAGARRLSAGLRREVS
jgi:hypothetical protein